MEEYTWVHGLNVFRLTIGEHHPRWEGNGILQFVTLSIDGYTVFYNNWGRESNLERFKEIDDDATQNIYRNELGISVLHKNWEGRIEYLVLSGDDEISFTDWLTFSLSPLPYKRKKKIDKILTKQR